MKLNLEEVQKRIDQHLIDVQVHPELPLKIYTYSRKCQYDRIWDEYTTMCRGLITDNEGNIIARPFGKFFNLDELPTLGIELPTCNYEVEEKMDGSLGILYTWEGVNYIATKGSFASEQSKEGTKMLHEAGLKLTTLNPRHTHLFEIIYPENRIVVDYKGSRKLVYLGAIDNETGKDVPRTEVPSVFYERFSIPVIFEFPLERIKELENNDDEGVVIHYSNGFRVKVKFEEYLRIHRIVTGVTTKALWEFLRDGTDIRPYLEKVPEEFSIWIKDKLIELTMEYVRLSRLVANTIYTIDKQHKPESDKEFAKILFEQYNDEKIDGLVFSLRSGKPSQFERAVWQRLRPKAESPFKKFDL